MMGASTHSGVLPTTLVVVVVVLEVVVLVVLDVVVLELVVLVLEMVLELVLVILVRSCWSASVQVDNRSEQSRICFSMVSLSADG